jgi:hypothetical protein
MAWAMLGIELERLPDERRRQVLEISVLATATLPALQTLAGESAETILQDLRELGVLPSSPTGPSLHALRERFAQEVGLQEAEAQARSAATRLLRAGRWDDALAIHARLGDRAALVDGLGIAVRAPRPLTSERVMFWAAQITDDEALRDADVVLLRSSLREQEGSLEAALALLTRASRSGAFGADLAARERFAAEAARLEARRDAGTAPGEDNPRPIISSLRRLWRSR